MQHNDGNYRPQHVVNNNDVEFNGRAAFNHGYQRGLGVANFHNMNQHAGEGGLRFGNVCHELELSNLNYQYHQNLANMTAYGRPQAASYMQSNFRVRNNNGRNNTVFGADRTSFEQPFGPQMPHAPPINNNANNCTTACQSAGDQPEQACSKQGTFEESDPANTSMPRSTGAIAKNTRSFSSATKFKPILTEAQVDYNEANFLAAVTEMQNNLPTLLEACDADELTWDQIKLTFPNDLIPVQPNYILNCSGCKKLLVDRYTLLVCGHKWHLECLLPALKVEQKCTICNTDLKEWLFCRYIKCCNTQMMYHLMTVKKAFENIVLAVAKSRMKVNPTH